MKSVRFAIIDLGSNSIRFDVYHARGPESVQLLHSQKTRLHLGDQVFSQGFINTAKCSELLALLHTFKQTAMDLAVVDIFAYGTSALREASNRDAIISEVNSSLGIELCCLSEQDEAYWIAQGILQRTPLQAPFVLFDMGGGSTEITIKRAPGSALEHFSFPLGSARIKHLFLKHIPPQTQDLRDLEAHMHSLFADLTNCSFPQPGALCLGSSGTVKGIVEILGHHNLDQRIAPKQIGKLLQQMKSLNREQLLGIPFMEERRVDMLLGGVYVLAELSQALNIAAFQYTPFSLKEGLLDRHMALYFPQSGKETRSC